jgi:hypothetical protein
MPIFKWELADIDPLITYDIEIFRYDPVGGGMTVPMPLGGIIHPENFDCRGLDCSVPVPLNYLPLRQYGWRIRAVRGNEGADVSDWSNTEPFVPGCTDTCSLMFCPSVILSKDAGADGLGTVITGGAGGAGGTGGGGADASISSGGAGGAAGVGGSVGIGGSSGGIAGTSGAGGSSCGSNNRCCTECTATADCAHVCSIDEANTTVQMTCKQYGVCGYTCGDGQCTAGLEDCSICPGDCACPSGKHCSNRQCVADATSGTGGGPGGAGGSGGTAGTTSGSAGSTSCNPSAPTFDCCVKCTLASSCATTCTVDSAQGAQTVTCATYGVCAH